MKKYCLFGLTTVAVMAACLGSTLPAGAQVTQEWARRMTFGTQLGNDQIEGLKVDAQGYIYVAGDIDLPHGPNAIALVKYSPQGEREWVTPYTGHFPEGCYVRDLTLDEDGYIYVGGTGYGLGPGEGGDYMTAKFDNQGTPVWLAVYDGPAHYFDHAWAIALDDSGNVYVTGEAANEGLPYEPDDFGTVKYNAQGVQQWVALYDGPGHGQDRAVDVAVDGLGNVYVFGDARMSGPSYVTDWALVKYDAQGMQQWVAHFGGAGYFAGNPCMLLLDDQDNILLTGEISSGGNADMGIVKYNPEGVLQWVAQYNTPENNSENVSAMRLDADGNIILAGSTDLDPTHRTLILKFDPNGNQIWVRRYESTSNSGHSLAVDAEGNIYVTGIDGWAYAHCLTLKYSPAGDLVWSTIFNDHDNCSYGRHVALDGEGNVLVAGNCQLLREPYAGDDFLTIKYDQSFARTAQGNWTQNAHYSSQNILAGSPNPFNPSKVLSFELRAASFMNLSVYDISGRQVAILVDGWRQAGVHDVTFDGSRLPSGVYLYRLQAGDFTTSGKMILMK
jgi:uncharacterized delta-60 repeat protein